MNTVSTVIALLTTMHHDGNDGAVELLERMPPAAVQLTLITAVSMLHREYELGCAEAGLDLGWYLQHIGLAAADL